MLSSIQLFSLFTITLIVLSVHYIHAVPVNSDGSDETISEENKIFDDESRLFKRRLPVEGILIGRRAFPSEGILLGKRAFPTEGILLGKRTYPTEGILLGKRNMRPVASKASMYNRLED